MSLSDNRRGEKFVFLLSIINVLSCSIYLWICACVSLRWEWKTLLSLPISSSSFLCPHSIKWCFNSNLISSQVLVPGDPFYSGSCNSQIQVPGNKRLKERWGEVINSLLVRATVPIVWSCFRIAISSLLHTSLQGQGWGVGDEVGPWGLAQVNFVSLKVTEGSLKPCGPGRWKGTDRGICVVSLCTWHLCIEYNILRHHRCRRTFGG